MTVVKCPIGPPVRLVIPDVDGARVTQEKVLTANAVAVVGKLLDQIAIIRGKTCHDLEWGRRLRQHNGTSRLATARATAELTGKVEKTLKH